MRNIFCGEVGSSIGYQTYKSKQNMFRKEFEEKFGGDFKKYMDYLKGKYPSL